MIRIPVAAGLLGLLALAGCAQQSMTPEAQAALTACRSRADEIYLKQNRALMSERDQSYEPLSSTGTKGVTTEGLSGLYSRDQMVASCLNDAGPASASTYYGTAPINTQGGSAPPAQPQAPAPAAPVTIAEPPASAGATPQPPLGGGHGGPLTVPPQ
jgi:hypothetical protein